MKRIHMAVAMVGLSLGLAGTASAQMKMSFFDRPAIAKFVNPEVGKGAVYEVTRTDAKDEKNRINEMGVVGKEMSEGKQGYWLQVSSTDPKGRPTLVKILLTPDDFQFHKIIMQIEGRGAMEMPFNPNAAREEKMTDSMKEWHSVGTETITVPAGTFVCEHWKNDTKGEDLWASAKVTPFGMVKQVGKTQTTVLTKVLNDVPDRITGPVTKFDPQQMMQQMQQQRQAKP
jgi:hypothetical protein